VHKSSFGVGRERLRSTDTVSRCLVALFPTPTKRGCRDTHRLLITHRMSHYALQRSSRIACALIDLLRGSRQA
jgi:hypothetical protein